MSESESSSYDESSPSASPQNKDLDLSPTREHCQTLSLSLIPGRGDVSPPQLSPGSSSCVVGRKSRYSWWRCVLACESDSTGVDDVLSRRRLHSVYTMETVVLQFQCVLPSATEPSRRLLHLSGTVCRRQYVRRRHCQFSAVD